MKPYYFKCPSCGNDHSFRKVHENSSDTGCLMLMFGGIIPFLIWNSSQSHKIICTKCDLIFRQPTPPVSQLASFATTVLMIIILSILFSILSIFLADTTYDLTNALHLSYIAQIVSENSKAVSIGISALLVLLIPFCFISYIVSNYLHRRKLRKTLRLDVEYNQDVTE